MTEEIFNCSKCGKELDQELAKCEMCRSSYCSDCLNEQGICVPCEKGMIS